MKLLLDACPSPRLAAALCDLNHEAVHAFDYDLGAAEDEVVLARADAEGRVLMSADTDFGTILARTGAEGPSVILIRRGESRRVDEMVGLITANLVTIESAAADGCVIVLGERTIRVRRLPIL